MANDILEKIKTAGFNYANEFVSENLHYLSKNKQKLFHGIEHLKSILNQEKNYRETCSKYSRNPDLP